MSTLADKPIKWLVRFSIGHRQLTGGFYTVEEAEKSIDKITNHCVGLEERKFKSQDKRLILEHALGKHIIRINGMDACNYVITLEEVIAEQ